MLEKFFNVDELENFGYVPTFDVHIMMPCFSDMREHTMSKHRYILHNAFDRACHEFCDDDGLNFYDNKRVTKKPMVSREE